MHGLEKDSNHHNRKLVGKNARIAIDAMRSTRTYSLPGYASRGSYGSNSLGMADDADFTVFPQEHLVRFLVDARKVVKQCPESQANVPETGSAEVGVASE